MKWAVCVPSNRPDRLKTFREAWQPLFEKHDAKLIVVLDEEPYDGVPDWIPRRTDMIRSWAFYQGWLMEPKYMLTLDDDVTPLPGVDIFDEYETVFERGAVYSHVLSVGGLTTSTRQMRGFPENAREHGNVAIQYGGWSGVLDYDAETQLEAGDEIGEEEFLPVVLPVPYGVMFTGSAMNMAWRRRYTPWMWQLPLVYEPFVRYQRYGDIWSAVIQKPLVDWAGRVIVINGRASVRHDRASDPERNRELEGPGRPVNQSMVMPYEPDFSHPETAAELEEMMLPAYVDVTDQFAEHVKRHDLEYAGWFRQCRDKWVDLFSSSPDSTKTPAGSGRYRTAGSRG